MRIFRPILPGATGRDRILACFGALAGPVLDDAERPVGGVGLRELARPGTRVSSDDVLASS